MPDASDPGPTTRPPTDSVPPESFWIAGSWRSTPGRRFPVHDPATDAILTHVADAAESEAVAAVDVADAAFSTWKQLPGVERGSIVRRIGEILVENRERLAHTITAEQGKPLAEARGEVDYSASFFRWFASEAERTYGHVIPTPVQGKRLYTVHQPAGVVAAITPWNFPAAMLARKVAPALAAGCTVVVKPAEATPLTALVMAELMQTAGLPDGAVNVVTGRDPVPIVRAWFDDPRIRVASFTGSTEVGRELMRLAAGNIVRLSLELGGHAPFIVFDDAELDLAVAGTIASKFRNAGQTCICANRIYVHDRIAAEFNARLANAVADLRVGNGAAVGVEIGPLVDEAAVSKVQRHVSDAVDKGGRILAGGHLLPELGSNFYAPTLIADATDTMAVTTEETFGPVAAVATFREEEEAIARANATPFGLAAYFYTRDYARLTRVAERLEFGIVGANDGTPSTPAAPFGGMKHSGLGREGGDVGIAEFLETKFVSVGGVD